MLFQSSNASTVTGTEACPFSLSSVRVVRTSSSGGTSAVSNVGVIRNATPTASEPETFVITGVTYSPFSGTTAAATTNFSITLSSLDNGAVFPALSRADEGRARRLRDRWQREQRRRARIEAVAAGRAETLLRGCLSPEQVRDFEEKGWFDVSVPSADGAVRRYRIRRGFAGNVRLLDAGDREVRSYCIHPRIRVPDADSMLAQKLLLEADERMFLATANARELAHG